MEENPLEFILSQIEFSEEQEKTLNDFMLLSERDKFKIILKAISELNE